MSNSLFKFKHSFHRVTKANSSDGELLICETCDVCNITPEQEAGSRRKLKELDDWIAYHERHGEVGNYGGGTNEYICDCGSSW